MSALPILYSFRRCPYAMRARLALRVSALVCELREVVLARKPAALLAASPKGTVPVLLTPDGQVIEQSLDIMLWALRQHDPLNWLRNEAQLTQISLPWIARCDTEFKPHLDRYKYPNRYDLATGEIHRSQGAGFLSDLERALAPQGKLLGASTSLADMAIAPFVRQFAHTDAAWFAAQPWPALQAWLSAFEGSALFSSVMEKYPPWAPGQAVQHFPLL